MAREANEPAGAAAFQQNGLFLVKKLMNREGLVEPAVRLASKKTCYAVPILPFSASANGI